MFEREIHNQKAVYEALKAHEWRERTQVVWEEIILGSRQW
jgi:hypothetical protein